MSSRTTLSCLGPGALALAMLVVIGSCVEMVEEESPIFRSFGEFEPGFRMLCGGSACGSGKCYTDPCGEECDDGNKDNGDGCDSSCKIESGYTCNCSTSSASICTKLEHNSPEECDDGNTVDNDGCDSNCKIEEGWVCSSYPSQCSFCGDGKIEYDEKCDDSNILSEDGCSTVCKIEIDYKCTGEPSVCNITKIEASAEVKQIGTAVSASLNAGMSSQLAIATILGQSLSSMWILINTLQIINYSAMMTLYFPKIVITLFSYLGVANLENKMFSNLYLLHFDNSQVEDRASWDYRFENQNVESTNVLLNCADMFFALILLGQINVKKAMKRIKRKIPANMNLRKIYERESIPKRMQENNNLCSEISEFQKSVSDNSKMSIFHSKPNIRPRLPTTDTIPPKIYHRDDPNLPSGSVQGFDGQQPRKLHVSNVKYGGRVFKM